MSSKPKHRFVYLALAMVFLLVTGLVVVGMLVANNRLPEFGATGTVMAMNPTTQAQLEGTRTQNSVNSISSFTPIPYDASMSATALPNFQPMPTLTRTLTFTPVDYFACSWQWARQPLDELGMTALQAFIEADMTSVAVRAEAYGENCIDGTANTANHFAAMTTDFYVDLSVLNPSDMDELADFVIRMYHILSGIPPTERPAPLGYLDIRFMPFEGPVTRFRAMFDQIKRAIDRGLTGEELLEELGGLS